MVMPGGVQCGECGAQVAPDDRFCGVCGTQVGPGVSAAPRSATRRMVWIALAAVLAVALGVGIVVAVTGGDDPATALLQPADDAGPDPFTPSVATAVQVVVLPDPTTSTTGGDPGGDGIHVVETPGDTARLYAGRPDDAEPLCDTADLDRRLADDPARASAWAEVADVRVDDIDTYLDSLVATVLTRDTLVVNHRFRDDRAEPFDAVLQAGTAVLVDDRGIPQVRCACGNPLASVAEPPGALSPTGEPWSDFVPAAVAWTTPAPDALPALQLAPLDGGDTITVRFGPAPTPPVSNTTVVPTPPSEPEPSSSTTTTAPPPPPTPPPRSALQLSGTAVGDVAFGTATEAALASLSLHLGSPDTDTGWEQFIPAAELSEPTFTEADEFYARDDPLDESWRYPVHRRVCWSALCLHFGGDIASDAPLRGWDLTNLDYPAQSPPGPDAELAGTGIRLGSTWGAVRAAYPGTAVKAGEGNSLVVDNTPWPGIFDGAGPWRLTGYWDYERPGYAANDERVTRLSAGEGPEPNCC